MNRKIDEQMLETAPKELKGNFVTLHFDTIKPGDPAKGHVPYYHFRIIDNTGNDVGHIGYEIKGQFRGHSYAYHACIAIAPFVKTFYPSVLLTCNPDNTASKRTIEKLNFTFLDEHELNQNEQAYKNGEKTRYRYLWNL